MDYEKLLEGFDKTIVKLSKTYHIPPLEWEDTAQELRINLWLKRDKYDPKRSYKDWAYIVCKRKIIDLSRYWSRQKRSEAKKISLDDLKDKGFEI